VDGSFHTYVGCHVTKSEVQAGAVTAHLSFGHGESHVARISPLQLRVVDALWFIFFYIFIENLFILLPSIIQLVYGENY
jgi:hypothetical protein